MLTPCTRKCRIESDGTCSGCRRTLEEIIRWAQITDAARDHIMKRIDESEKKEL